VIARSIPSSLRWSSSAENTLTIDSGTIRTSFRSAGQPVRAGLPCLNNLFRQRRSHSRGCLLFWTDKQRPLQSTLQLVEGSSPSLTVLDLARLSLASLVLSKYIGSVLHPSAVLPCSRCSGWTLLFMSRVRLCPSTAWNAVATPLPEVTDDKSWE
jgi:hypothetical protein